MTIWDVVVAGAGPAGSVAAALLARAGARTVLLDRPRYGDCKIGETLPGAGARLLAGLGLPAPAEPGVHRPIGGVISAWGGPPAAQDFLNDPDGPGWRLDRIAFEDDLRQGAEVAGAHRVEARVRKVTREGTAWRFATDCDGELQSAWFVDATGRAARLSRWAGASREPGPSLVAVWAVGAIAGEGGTRSDRTLIQAQEDGWWYGAFLPNGRPIAAFHTAPETASRLRRDPAAWRDKLAAAEVLSRRLSPARFAAARLRGADAGSSFLRPSAGEGWIACGDATIAFDPLASQGIFNALSTGETAAQTLLAANCRAAARDYEGRLAKIGRIYGERRRTYYRMAARTFPKSFWIENASDSQLTVL